MIERSSSGVGERRVASMGPPPVPLVAVFGIVVFYLYLSDSYERALLGLKVFSVLFPLSLLFLLRGRGGPAEAGGLGGGGGFRIPSFSTAPENAGGTGKVALFLLLVLLLMSWHPTLKSKWTLPSSS